MTLDEPLRNLGLSTRAEQALASLGVTKAGELLGLELREVGRIRGVGPRTLREVAECQRYVKSESMKT